MTLASLLLRLISLFVNTRISSLLGAEGMGLMQLGFSVEALAVTLAISGVRFSVTRLAAEELGLGRKGEVRCVVAGAMRYALFFSCLSGMLLTLLAPAAARLAGDGRLALPLRCFALSLPFLALNSVFSGYFTAVFRPWKATVSQALEQVLGAAFTLLALPRLPADRPELCCAAVALANALADLGSLLVSYLLYKFEQRAVTRPGRPPALGRRLMKLSLPLALSSYARTALSTLQHLLVPRALMKGGVGAAAALGVYGTVSGMVFPVLGFASVFFNALAELLIPELTEAQMRGDRDGLERSASRILSSCLLGSAGIAALLWFLGPRLGLLLYRSAEAGSYLRSLAPLVTVMYLDSVVDGMLKGLGLHLSSMVINITDAVLTLAGVYFLLPRFGVPAYIALLYGSECFNFLLSFLRLRRLLPIKLL
jgi:stage V sporulation protein B